MASSLAAGSGSKTASEQHGEASEVSVLCLSRLDTVNGIRLSSRTRVFLFAPQEHRPVQLCFVRPWLASCLRAMGLSSI